MNAEQRLVQSLGEPEIGRRGVHRVAADDDEDVDLAGVHVGDEIPKRVELIGRFRFDRLRVDDRLADVAKRLVDAVRQGVDGGRLAVAGDDEAAAAMRLQILSDRVDPFRDRRAEPLHHSSPTHRT